MATAMPRPTYSPRTQSRSPDIHSRRKETYHPHHRDRYQPSHRRSHTPDYSSRSRSPSPRRHPNNRRRSRSRSPSYHHHRQRSYSRSPRRRADEDEEEDRRYNRSPSPYSKRRRHSYSRSRSPRRRAKDAPSSKKSTAGGGGGGFKWKDPATTTTNAEPNAGGSEKKGLDRGYSSHYTHQPARPKSPSPERDDLASKFGAGYSARYHRPAPSSGDGDVTAKFGTSAPTTAADGAGDGDDEDSRRRQRKRERKEKKAREGPRPVEGPMIVVNVNDRLGTKVAVPCLASDPIRLFKAQVAARVGRQPHEIMLKRQGERPFRDGLTLEDYGVSNGVQLDLEVDTGE